MRRLFQPKVRLSLLVAWCAAWLVVAALLLAPLPAPRAPSDLLGHALLFGAMALGAVSFCHRAGQLALLALLTIAGGTALEFAQGLVPYRTFDFHDAIANAIGAGLGYLIAVAVLNGLIRPAEAVLGRP